MQRDEELSRKSEEVLVMYAYKTSKSKAGYTISFWMHSEEDNSDSLLPSNVVVPKLVPVWRLHSYRYRFVCLFVCLFGGSFVVGLGTD